MESEFVSPYPGHARLWLVDEDFIYHMDTPVPKDISLGLRLGIKEYWEAFLIFTDQALREFQEPPAAPVGEE